MPRVWDRKKEKRTLLTAAQLLDTLLFIMFAVERNTNANPSIVLDRFTLLIIRVIIHGTSLISLSLDNETTTAGWDEALENGGEFLGNLLKCSLDGFIFTLVQDVDKFLDGALGGFELLATLGEGVTLLGKVVVLLEGLLINVLVFLQCLVDFLKTFGNLS
jgi:hypothetical protein